jgi:GT2 family glycosyltransferase
MHSKIVVVIISFNGIQWIEKCLQSIPSNNTVIVVDNNSSDGTVAFIEKNYTQAILLKQTENLGFGAANNLGFRYALKNEADYVFLLNQDAYLQDGVIEKLVEVSKNNLEYGIISPIHLNGLGNKLDFNFSKYVANSKELQFDALQNKYFKNIYEVPFVNAAGWLLPKSTLELIGGFDPIFYHYGEDNNYCNRVIFYGLKIGVVPNTYIQHDREFRVPKSNEYCRLIEKEKYFKDRWSNINIAVREEIEKQKSSLRRLILKLIIQFKFKKIAYYKSELNLINRISPEIYKSRKINLKKGKHYL